MNNRKKEYLSNVIFVLIVAGGFLVLLFVSKLDLSASKSSMINIIGLSFDFVGVILLSSIFLNLSERLYWVQAVTYRVILTAYMAMSIGFIAGMIYLAFMGQEIMEVWQAPMVIITLGGSALFIIEMQAELFAPSYFRVLKNRMSFVGLFLLLYGLVIQIYASSIQLKIA